MSATETTEAGVAVELIGTCEAARILGVHRNTIRHWAENGTLRARVLPTGARRFDRDEVERVRAHPATGVDERRILQRVDRGGILIGERELRYQLSARTTIRWPARTGCWTFSLSLSSTAWSRPSCAFASRQWAVSASLRPMMAVGVIGDEWRSGRT